MVAEVEAPRLAVGGMAATGATGRVERADTAATGSGWAALATGGTAATGSGWAVLATEGGAAPGSGEQVAAGWAGRAVTPARWEAHPAAARVAAREAARAAPPLAARQVARSVVRVEVAVGAGLAARRRLAAAAGAACARAWRPTGRASSVVRPLQGRNSTSACVANNNNKNAPAVELSWDSAAGDTRGAEATQRRALGQVVAGAGEGCSSRQRLPRSAWRRVETASGNRVRETWPCGRTVELCSTPASAAPGPRSARGRRR